jgi:hypothetical protein
MRFLTVIGTINQVTDSAWPAKLELQLGSNFSQREVSLRLQRGV